MGQKSVIIIYFKKSSSLEQLINSLKNFKHQSFIFVYFILLKKRRGGMAEKGWGGGEKDEKENQGRGMGETLK